MNPMLNQRFAPWIALPFIIIITGFLWSQTATSTEGQLHPKVESASGFTVVGIQVRTTNSAEETGSGAITQQWQRFMTDSLLDKIPHKSDSNIIAVYTDYANIKGSKDVEYNYVLGAKVDSATGLPAGMVAKKIPAGRYSVITTQKGPLWEVVPAAWKQIWASPKSVLGGDRAFKSDYEVYDTNTLDPGNGQADIHVGIK
ncbi:MAG TPA: GyrI-like domain-containing protein [Terriglobales bacterium]